MHRFVTIWFRYLRTDWFRRRQLVEPDIAFVLAAPDHGRMVVTAANAIARSQGLITGMSVADARAILPSLQVLDDIPNLSGKLLSAIAEWCIRYTPAVAIDSTSGLILDATGCAHLWGGEEKYLSDITRRLNNFGYDVKLCMADTIGSAWAMTRAGKVTIIEPGKHATAILSLPAASLRLETATIERLEKLGLRHVNNFISMPRVSLRRRFGELLLKRIDQALGNEKEWIQTVQPINPYEERLPCIEPIVTATGIGIAIEKLLDTLCRRLHQEGKGLRTAVLSCYRVDGKVIRLSIGTNRPCANPPHLFKLFEIKIESIEPALGIELFTLDASKVEELLPMQEKLWGHTDFLAGGELAELLDRIGGKIGVDKIHRYVPDEHYWPERSYKQAISIDEKLQSSWKLNRPRPLQILSPPEFIEVTAPIPDYPPMLFRYRGHLHKIMKADGPERIEQEWWLEDGQHRDYYTVEDEAGKRYWLFRLGHYDPAKTYKWFLHGFFS